MRLHANELPWRSPAMAREAGLNRYPEPHPHELTRGAGAPLRRRPAPMLLAGRGSDEAIDLLIRSYCRAGAGCGDRSVRRPSACTRVAARIQGARVLEVPLLRERGFALDTEAVARAATAALRGA